MQKINVETAEEIQAAALRKINEAKRRLRQKDLSWADKIALERSIERVERYMEKCYRCGKPLSVMEMEAGKGDDIVYCSDCDTKEKLKP